LKTEKDAGQLFDRDTHADYSPSSLGMFEKCPGFRNRKDNPGRAAEMGKRIHDALEHDAIDDLSEENERKIAQQCRDYIDSLIAERRPRLPDHDYRELQLNIDLGADLHTYGTSDRLIIYGKEGLLIDYKSGLRFVIDAEENAQIWAYVLGSFQRFSELDTITAYVLQPRRDDISYHTFERKFCTEIQLRLNTIVRLAIECDPDKFSPQPELCEYCARQTNCPALAAKALKISARLAPGLPIPESVIVRKEHPEDIPHLLRLAPLMEAWAKGIRQEALRVNLEEGVEIKGFKRIERSTPRAVTSVLGAWDAVKSKGISLEDFLAACSTVSLPDLEELVAKMAKRGHKEEAKQELEDTLRSALVLKDTRQIFYFREEKK
jgi:Protein of unknown function (DUF2800)